jgi:hypothetical protein
MQVNSADTVRRAVAYRKSKSGKSWLDLSRSKNASKPGIVFFTGKTHGKTTAK